MQLTRTIRGFTLVEILVALAIISLLTTVVFGAINGSRAKARDAQRMSDLEQIHIALRLYAEANGEYPCEDAAQCNAAGQVSGANGQIGTGGNFDTLLAPYLPTVPQDPLQDSTHYYYYDARHTCGGHPIQAVLFARTMETEKFKNINDTMCSSMGTEGGNKDNGHVIIIGQSPDTY